MTDKNVNNNDWVLYDGTCSICRGFIRRFAAALEGRGFTCVPLQTDWVRRRLNLSEAELMLEMRVLQRSGNVVGGAPAVLVLVHRFWWGLPLVWLAKLPWVFRVLDRAYRWGASRRYCLNGACKIRRRTPWYVLGLPAAALLSHGKVEPWVFMWIMAGSLWFALKIFTLIEAPSRSWGRSIAYVATWPGMDAPEFLREAAVRSPNAREWLYGALNIAVGLGAIFAGVRAAYPESPLLAGWIGMIGIVLVLHFGVFKGLSLFWRAMGVLATPIMDAPLKSRSLSEFWGRRWNTGFSIPARRHVMEPITRKFGTRAGLLTVFAVSGLVHELVISLPANACYGLPMAYFVIQGVALMIERRFGANRWLTLLCVAAPAFILFHPPFVHRVIVPFLNAIGAL